MTFFTRNYYLNPLHKKSHGYLPWLYFLKYRPIEKLQNMGFRHPPEVDTASRARSPALPWRQSGPSYALVENHDDFAARREPWLPGQNLWKALASGMGHLA